MRISTKGRYALRFLVELSTAAKGEFISLPEVSRRQNISKKYLEQIVPELTGKNLLVQKKGKLGGYRLSRDPSSITCAEVLQMTETLNSCVKCLDQGSDGCDRKESCPTLLLWKGLDKAVNDYLSSVTIADLADSSNQNLYEI